MGIYRKILLFGVFFLIPVFSIGADTIVSGTITTDATWSPTAGGVYIIDSSFSVASGTTLTIEPGTIIKARTTGMGGPSIYGRLIANGTSELPVLFTSMSDDTPGQWQGLYFKPGSVGEFDRVILRYAGDGGYGYGNFVGIENDGGVLDIRNSHIYDNYKFFFPSNIFLGTGIRNIGNLSVSNSVIENQVYGILGESGTVAVSNTQILNNTEMGLYATELDSLTLLNNVFSNNRKTAQVSASVNFTHEGNTSSDQTYRGFEVVGTAVDGAVWHSRDLPLLITQGSLTVLSGRTLTIEPGTVIKLGGPSRQGQIVISGNLAAEGAKSSPIFFTSYKDDSVEGDTNGDGDSSIPFARDWQALIFEAGSNGALDHVNIKYGGETLLVPGVFASVYNRGASLDIKNSFVGNNLSEGLYQSAGETLIDKSEFTKQGWGIRVTGGDLSVHQSSFHGNVSHGVENTSFNVVDAINNWWGSATGPAPTGTGDKVSTNVLYDPWLGSDPLIASPRNPVIIVPGIMATKLIDKDTLFDNVIWPNFAQIGLSITDNFLDVLKMNDGGIPDDSNITKGEVITKFSDADYFQGLIDSLIQHGYQENIDLFIFPYDWRFDIGTSTETLSEKINQIKLQPGVQKIDIVSHSMGGLLAKEYIRQHGGDYIDKFIDIGTPHLGSPNAFKTLMYGDNIGISYILGLFNLNQERIKIISQNMPSVYQLLPSYSYGSYLYDLDDLDDNEVGGLLNYIDTKNFLKNTSRNALLVDRADAFHQEIDNLSPATFGVKTYNIVGCGTQTLDKIFILNRETSGGTEYNISYTNGDGTVPLKSAEAISANKTYYLRNATHALMPSTSGVKELIASILGGEDFDISPYPNLALSANGCSIPNGKIVSFHSPIELHIYVGDNHVGPNADGDIEINIPGVSYEVIDGNKFAYLPDGAEYTVRGVATDDGTFNARIETIQNEVVTETRYFNQVPIASTTQVELTNDLVLIDNNSDGTFESTLPVSSILNESQSSDITKPVTVMTTNPTGKKDGKFDKPVKIILTATDDNSGVLKTEYSLNTGSTWLVYLDSFTIGTKGENKILYRSTDRAGNVESPKTATIIINPPGNSGKK